MREDTEIFELTSGQSLIDVRGDGFDQALLVGGQPIVFNWCDCEGSVAQYLARAGRTNCERELQSLRHTLAGNWLPEFPISAQIFPFLDLFVPGRYRLQYFEARPDCDYIDFDAAWDFAKKHDSFYPFACVLVFTQSSDSLNRNQLAHYLERIRNGDQPIALTVTVADGWCDYVIDGHHKLQAYKLAKVKPTFVSVQAGEATLALALDWQVFGGGAAALTGEIIDGNGPVALLRPFAEPGVKWSNGSAKATFRSELFDIAFESAITMRNASLGLFNASFAIGREQFEVIGTSSSASEVVIVGVSGSQIITITGQVQTDRRTGALSINGSYQIQTPAGKSTDSGIIAILIG